MLLYILSFPSTWNPTTQAEPFKARSQDKDFLPLSCWVFWSQCWVVNTATRTNKYLFHTAEICCLWSQKSEINSSSRAFTASGASGKVCPFPLFGVCSSGCFLAWGYITPICLWWSCGLLCVCLSLLCKSLTRNLSWDLRPIHFIQNDVISRPITWFYLQRPFGHIYRLQGSRTYGSFFNCVGMWGWGSPFGTFQVDKQ